MDQLVVTEENFIVIAGLRVTEGAFGHFLAGIDLFHRFTVCRFQIALVLFGVTADASL